MNKYEITGGQKMAIATNVTAILKHHNILSGPARDDLIEMIERHIQNAVSYVHRDYQEVIDSHKSNVRALDVALNGEAGAAKQASLCDILAQVKSEGIRSGPNTPIGYAPTYLTERLDAGDSGVMLTVTRKPLPGHGVTVALYTAPVPAAGVQGGKQTDLAKRLLFKANDTEGNQISVMKADLIAICCEANRYYSGMMNWKATAEAKDATLQPDSGRDAALLEYFNASVEFNNSHGDGPDGETLAEAVQRSRKAEERFDKATQAAHKALAAHPAPSSDAAQTVTQDAPRTLLQSYIGKSFKGIASAPWTLDNVSFKRGAVLKDCLGQKSEKPNAQNVLIHFSAPTENPAPGWRVEQDSGREEIFRNLKSGELYEKLGAVKAKINGSGWWDSVHYRSVADGQEYVTDVQRWESNFNLVKASDD